MLEYLGQKGTVYPKILQIGLFILENEKFCNQRTKLIY